jgi:hypothetical protein
MKKNRVVSVAIALASLFIFNGCSRTSDNSKVSSNVNSSSSTITALEQSIGLKKYEPSIKYVKRPGLYVQNGVVMHEGNVYSSIGANFFSAFYNAFMNNTTTEYNDVFPLMNSYGIEYCRINLHLYYPIDYKKYDANKLKYFQTMDALVKSAEQHHIGLICSMFWNLQGISDYFDEPQNAWANKSSKTRQYMSDYIHLVVSRYKESPAIWGWEFSCELNTILDLPNAANYYAGSIHPELGTRLTRDKSDDLTTDIAEPLLRDFATLVRQYDPYDRLTTSGNDAPRSSQYNQRINNSWQTDTQAEMAQTLEWHDPAPMDCVSVHLHDINMLKIYKDESLKQGKALFVGEFSPDQPNCEQVVDGIVANKIPLSAVWSLGSFEYLPGGFTTPTRKAQVLTYIQNANKKIMSNMINGK